jgi:protocatechuate 3,4-dioxygenase alpha subunit
MDGHSRPALDPTVSQTVGPFFHIGLKWLFSDRVAKPGTPGRHIVVEGRVLDGDGVPVSDALVEVWQADAQGNYALAEDLPGSGGALGFGGFARVPTNDDGVFRFATVKPGRVRDPAGGMQAPHLLVSIFMRGLLRHLATRIYFADEPSNTEDLVLSRVQASRRHTLIAAPSPDSPDAFEWNIVLQGTAETVFFDL